MQSDIGAASVVPSESSGVSDPLVTIVVASVLDWKGRLRAVRIDPSVTVHAVLSVGNEDTCNNASDKPAVCKPNIQ